MTVITAKVQNPERSIPISKTALLKDYSGVFDKLPGDAMRGDNAPINVFAQLANSAEVAKRFFPYWAESKLVMSLSMRAQEIIILRSACLFGCEYVWGHHCVVSAEIGILDSEIQQLKLPIENITLDPVDKLLVEVTDQIYKSANISDDLWDRLHKHYGQEELLDMITVISQYIIFNSVNNIFGIPLENNKMPIFGKTLSEYQQ